MKPRMANRFGEMLRFVKYLPRIYRAHVHHCQLRFHGIDEYSSVLFFDRDTYISTPNDVHTYTNWQEFLNIVGVQEVSAFRHLASDCSTMLDIGGAEGLFSALFAAVSKSPKRIVAVEPTDHSARLHRETARLNAKPGLDWQVLQVALSDQITETTLGSNVLEGHFQQFSEVHNVEQPLQVTTLDALTTQHGFVPELIKIDIDSFEYEVFTGSPDYLAKHKPKVHFELHPADLQRRGKKPEELMKLIQKSHVVHSAIPSDYMNAPVARLTLLPK